MGRYYSGDIEGKFWFAVQSSTDADFFGVKGEEPSYVNYYFNREDDLENIKKGIDKCKGALGEWKEKLDKFFENNSSYDSRGNDFKEQIGLDQDKFRSVLEWYARLDLGTQILDCVEKNGECSFEAEC